jgi:hypothetical protein
MSPKSNTCALSLPDTVDRCGFLKMESVSLRSLFRLPTRKKTRAPARGKIMKRSERILINKLEEHLANTFCIVVGHGVGWKISSLKEGDDRTYGLSENRQV